MNKKGFTLIELLAVIVILAIIALIATPMIMGVIDDARKGAAEASANGYIDAVEGSPIYTMIETGSDTGLTSGVYAVGTTEKSEGLNGSVMKMSEKATVKVKGEAPTAGWVAVGDNGVVVAACLKFNSYSKNIGYNTTKHAKAMDDATITVPADVEAAEKAMESLK